METTFTAPGISCQGCANTIEQVLARIPQVAGVTVDVPNKTVTVSHGGKEIREDKGTSLNIYSVMSAYPFPKSSPQRHLRPC